MISSAISLLFLQLHTNISFLFKAQFWYKLDNSLVRVIKLVLVSVIIKGVPVSSTAEGKIKGNSLIKILSRFTFQYPLGSTSKVKIKLYIFQGYNFRFLMMMQGFHNHHTVLIFLNGSNNSKNSFIYSSFSLQLINKRWSSCFINI